MKSLIILKGLVKTEKLEWVRNQQLENYFIDYDIISKLYSYPDLLTPKQPVLNRSFGNQTYSRFMEILCTKMSKGCLVVVDIETESTSTIETLALIFGYTVFYVIFDVPQDYISGQKKYALTYYPPKKRKELEREINNFTSLSFSDKIVIKTYKDVLSWWKKEKFIIDIHKEFSILHVSDLHSNTDLYKRLPNIKKFDKVIFYGDYVDGPVAGGSKELLDKAINNKTKSAIWLEGNHELRVRKYLGWIILKSEGKKELTEVLFKLIPEDFIEQTSGEFEMTAGEARDYLSKMNSSLKMFCILNMNGQQYICTHAGILYKEQIDPRYIGSVIYGNREMNRFDRQFSSTGKKINLWSIHAHCQYPDSWEVMRYDRVINLDPPSENEIVYGIQNNGEWEICLLEK